tara:strand:- start:9961 stop:10221 length:261 start_codon:yes stop_codon:yes gene_type:complete
MPESKNHNRKHFGVKPRKSLEGYPLKQISKNSSIRFIAEYKQKVFLEKLFKKNTIDFNNYFKDSRRIEKGKRFKLIETENHYYGNI